MCVPIWLGKKYLHEKVIFNETVKRWMEYSKKERNSLLYDVDELYIHLEYTQNGVIFCSHPNYKLNGKWYDWVMV